MVQTQAASSPLGWPSSRRYGRLRAPLCLQHPPVGEKEQEHTHLLRPLIWKVQQALCSHRSHATPSPKPVTPGQPKRQRSRESTVKDNRWPLPNLLLGRLSSVWRGWGWCSVQSLSSLKHKGVSCSHMSLVGWWEGCLIMARWGTPAGAATCPTLLVATPEGEDSRTGQSHNEMYFCGQN